MLTRDEALAVATALYETSADVASLGLGDVAERLRQLGQLIEATQTTGGLIARPFAHREAHRMTTEPHRPASHRKPRQRRASAAFGRLAASWVPTYVGGWLIARRIRRAGRHQLVEAAER